MKIQRTYPQPDSPEPHLGARERALAVFKYLLNIEPEQAKDHPMFKCIMHAFEQAAERAVLLAEDRELRQLEPSVVPMLTSCRYVDNVAKHVPDEGPL